MSKQTFENQSMLVVVGVGGTSIIAATASDAIKYEVKEVSPMLEDHFPDNAPAEEGLYVWEGTLTVERGGWAGESEIDPDAWWEGAFRPATLADIFRFDMLHTQHVKAPDAVPTAEVPVLQLKCYHLCVHNVGLSPYDAVRNHSGHNSFELVDPAEGTRELVQAWLNAETADGGPTLRHLEIEDRTGVRRFVAQRRGNLSMFFDGSITFDAYTDFAGVLPNPGVVPEAMKKGNPCRDIVLGVHEGGVA